MAVNNRRNNPGDQSSNIQAYLNGDWNVICDTCGSKRKRTECELSYGTGDIAVLVTCIDGCSDYRHPVNEPPPIIFDGQPVPDARPEGKDQLVLTYNNQGISGGIGSIYRFGKNWPGRTWNVTNDDSGMSFNPQQLWGMFT